MPHPLQVSADVPPVVDALRSLLAVLGTVPIPRSRLALAFDEFRASFGSGPPPEGVSVDSTNRPDWPGLQALIRDSTALTAEGRDALAGLLDVWGHADFSTSPWVEEDRPELATDQRRASDKEFQQRFSDEPIRKVRGAIRNAITALQPSGTVPVAEQESEGAIPPRPPDWNDSEGTGSGGELLTGKMPGVVSLNVLRATLEMLGHPEWRKRFESWPEVPYLRLRCAELFPGQRFSPATIELLIAWFQEHGGLTPDQARHLPLSEAVRRLRASADPPPEQPSDATQFARFLELHALVAAPETHRVSLTTLEEYQRLLTRFGLYAADGVTVGPPDPTRVPNSDPILNSDCIPIPGTKPLVCPRSSPKLPVELLPQVEARFRSLRLVAPDQTVLWVGRQAGMESVCMYRNGCTCFGESAPPTGTKQGEGGKPKPDAKPDGPFDADGFRFAGVDVRFGRAALQYRLVLALWDTKEKRPAEPRPAEDVISAVCGATRTKPRTRRSGNFAWTPEAGFRRQTVRSIFGRRTVRCNSPGCRLAQDL